MERTLEEKLGKSIWRNIRIGLATLGVLYTINVSIQLSGYINTKSKIHETVSRMAVLAEEYLEYYRDLDNAKSPSEEIKRKIYETDVSLVQSVHNKRRLERDLDYHLMKAVLGPWY